MPLPEDPRAYMRLAASLRKQIRDGTWKPGDHVPSIAVLSEETGHSRQTAGRAVQVLEREGLLMRTPGLGYFVCQADADPEGGS
jgi:GntR family transcriptional regulator, histidine utilization repressor